jgi:hypothetical protein
MVTNMSERVAAKRVAKGRPQAKKVAAPRSIRLGSRPKTARALMKKVQRISAQLLPQLPHVDPGYLSMIVEALLRPAEQRVVFVRPLGNGIGRVY